MASVTDLDHVWELDPSSYCTQCPLFHRDTDRSVYQCVFYRDQKHPSHGECTRPGFCKVARVTITEKGGADDSL